MFERHAGQIDRRALAAAHFLHRLIVIVQRAHPHALSFGLPFQFVADFHLAGSDRAGDHGAVALHDKGAIDGQAEPLAAGARLDFPTSVGNGGLQFIQSQAGDG